MTGERTKSILMAGIVPDETVTEISRWGEPLPEVEVVNDRAAVLEMIREAVEGPKPVEIRQTVLDALRLFEHRKESGRLYYADRGKTKFTDVDFMVDSVGNYIIPWVAENITDFMLDPDTYLKPTGSPRVFFMDVDEAFYGEKKMFLVCKPLRGPDV